METRAKTTNAAPEHTHTSAEELHRFIEGMQAQIGTLRRRLGAPEPADEDLDPNALLEELAAALEELRVAEEEIHVQNEELQLAQMVTEAAERRYRDLFTMAPDGYVVTDLSAAIQEANAAAADLLRCPEHYLRGKPLATYVAQEDRRRFRRLVLKLQEGTREGAAFRQWPVRLKPRGAAPVACEVTVSPAFTRKGVPVGWRWLLRDVSERERLEREAISAAERERRRIGQELHDDLAQRLSGASMLASVLGRDLSASGSPLSEDAARLAVILKDAHDLTRKLAHRLYATPVTPETLPDALAALAEGARETYDVDCRFEHHGTPVVPNDEVATHLLRIAQEAVSNALRHAAPRTLTISISGSLAGGVLRVTDDGRGLPEAPPDAYAGLGMRTMRHRASVIGATLDVHPREGGGTVVECRF